jgi:hypothetical protein
MELLNPFNFVSIGASFYAILGGFMDGFRMGTIHQKHQAMTRRFQFSVPHPSP